MLNETWLKELWSDPLYNTRSFNYDFILMLSFEHVFVSEKIVN